MILNNKKMRSFLKSLFSVVFCFFVSLFVLNTAGFAQSGCVGWYSTNSSGQISYFNTVTNTYTTLGTYTTSTNINAAAVQPSTGNIFFVNRATRKVIVYDVTNGSFTTLSGTLPSLGTIVGAAFNNSGTFYVMYDVFRMITVDPSTGSQTGSTITYTGVPGDGGSPAGTNGDIAFDSSGQMWMVGNNSSSSTRLYQVTISGTTATATASPASNISGIGTNAIVGLAIDSVTGNFYINTNGGTFILNRTTGAATSLTSATGNDLASCAVAPAAPTISKSFSPTSATATPATSTLTITIPNTNYTENFLTANLVDTLPSGMTVASPNGLSGTCDDTAGNTITATAGSSTITFNSGGRIATGGCTIIVNVTVSSAGTYTNTIAANGLRTLIGNNASAASAVFTVTLSPDLTISKSHTGNFTRGSTGTYTITVSNSGTAATSGTITVTDTLPTGLSVNGGAAGGITEGGTNAANWTCNSDAATPQIITCTSTTAIAISGNSVFTFSVNVSLTAASSVTNSVSVSGGSEATANNGNNSATDPTTTVAAPPNISLVKSWTSPTCSSNCAATNPVQLPETDITFQIAFTNSGGQGASSLRIVDGVPDNMDYKIGTAAVSSGVTFTIEFSSDYNPLIPSSATWGYTPVSQGGGASAGYDRLVKAIRWSANAAIPNTSPNNSGNVSFVAKIR